MPEVRCESGFQKIERIDRARERYLRLPEHERNFLRSLPPEKKSFCYHYHYHYHHHCIRAQRDIPQMQHTSQ